MKTSRVIDLYGFKLSDTLALEEFIRLRNYPHRDGLTGMDVSDSCDFDELVVEFKEYLEDKRATDHLSEEEKQKYREEKQKYDEEKNRAIASMLISSGFSFDGYTITKYSGYISGDDVVQIDRGKDSIFSGVTDVGDALSAGLVKIRRQALAELKEAAFALGCNAVVGVDFDYITLEPQTANASGGTTYLPYVICVTANGNAVVIEKNE